LNPIILLRDPELIKMVTVKDFEHFLDRGIPISEEVEPLFGKGLFSLKGEFFIPNIPLLLGPERFTTVARSDVSQSTKKKAILCGTHHLM
jgi:hypothetical protein